MWSGLIRAAKMFSICDCQTDVDLFVSTFWHCWVCVQFVRRSGSGPGTSPLHMQSTSNFHHFFCVPPRDVMGFKIRHQFRMWVEFDRGPAIDRTSVVSFVIVRSKFSFDVSPLLAGYLHMVIIILTQHLAGWFFYSWVFSSHRYYWCTREQSQIGSQQPKGAGASSAG